MRRIFFISLFFCFIISSAYTQENSNSSEGKVQSIESIVSSIYEVVSGEKGEERNWELMRTIFHPEARLILNYTDENGVKNIYFYSVDEYISTFGEGLKQSDLYEKDV